MVRKVEVHVDEWRAGDRGTVLTTSGVEAGVMIALSNQRTGQGYLGSLLAVEDIPHLLEAVKHDVEDRRYDVLAWYGGVAFAPNNRIRVEEFRRQVARLLHRTEFIVQQELWLPHRK